MIKTDIVQVFIRGEKKNKNKTILAKVRLVFLYAPESELTNPQPSSPLSLFHCANCKRKATVTLTILTIGLLFADH